MQAACGIEHVHGFPVRFDERVTRPTEGTAQAHQAGVWVYGGLHRFAPCLQWRQNLAPPRIIPRCFTAWGRFGGDHDGTAQDQLRGRSNGRSGCALAPVSKPVRALHARGLAFHCRRGRSMGRRRSPGSDPRALHCLRLRGVRGGAAELSAPQAERRAGRAYSAIMARALTIRDVPRDSECINHHGAF